MDSKRTSEIFVNCLTSVIYCCVRSLTDNRSKSTGIKYLNCISFSSWAYMHRRQTTAWLLCTGIDYLYCISLFRGYEEIPWDNMLPPKKWAPTSTLEEKPDMISQRYTLKRYDAGGKEWQAVGTSWDCFQTRDGNYKKGHIVL